MTHLPQIRCADLQALFIDPPAGYGEVPFYWWVGEKLTKERLLWQLEQLLPSRPSGLQVNYAHTDQGGNSFGLTIKSDPPLFSEAWWELFIWWAGKCNERGIAVSLSDYTLGIVGQGWWMDEILDEAPEMTGRTLEYIEYTVAGSEPFTAVLPENILSVVAYGQREQIDLSGQVNGTQLCWTPPPGSWRIVAVYYHINVNSVDPLHPKLGEMVIARFFQKFEDRMPGTAGQGLNFFFSDELTFGVKGKLWTNGFENAFSQAKGYDLLPLLPGLFVDIGKLTIKVRLDFYDVMTKLTEEAYFKPLFDWHQQRGMIYGCDHGGRGFDVQEFGDYFRTQSWMSGPGCDQPRLEDNVVKNKVASSIAHLYRRPRVWLEGYHSSGWGTSSADITRATFENFVSGQNLLSLHGLYYSTYGGWWEWAPPCNHFRMPYWAHMPVWMRWLRRISYLMSQGVHRCDVAIVYPVETAQAELDPEGAAKTAFAVGTALFDQGLDFDFIDSDSLARCEVVDRQLRVSGESYKVLILPAMTAVRYSTIEKMREFHNDGGLVIALETLPVASDRAGADDRQMQEELDAIFRSPGCRGIFCANADSVQLEEIITQAIQRDFIPSASCRVNHRKIDDHDVFMITNATEGMECDFRAAGKAQLWDPWQGTMSDLPVIAANDGYTRLQLPLGEEEAQFVVFSVGQAKQKTKITVEQEEMLLDGDWEFELQPTLDNRWGDFRLPPAAGLIGAEARRFQYGEGETLDQVEAWRPVTYGMGVYFLQTGPLTENSDPDLAPWRDYEFSWREGVPDDPGHQGYHGLKGQVADEFLVWGKPVQGSTEVIYKPERSPDECHYFRTSIWSEVPQTARLAICGNPPDKIWLNNREMGDFDKPVELKPGANPVQLRYRGSGRGAVVPLLNDAPEKYRQNIPLAMNWYQRPGVIPFDVKYGKRSIGWYKFIAPPGLRGMKFACKGKLSAWINGEVLYYKNNGIALDKIIPEPVEVIFRIEHVQGVYAGAVFDLPVELDCGPGKITLGDWSKIGVLEAYSGGAWYRQTICLTREQIRDQMILDLGQVVSSAEIRVNGQLAGVKLAPPWRMDIASLLIPGENRLEILVFNTLANHYLTIPTRYRGDPTSGLIAPVKLRPMFKTSRANY
jgi:hypothetical protein